MTAAAAAADGPRVAHLRSALQGAVRKSASQVDVADLAARLPADAAARHEATLAKYHQQFAARIATDTVAEFEDIIAETRGDRKTSVRQRLNDLDACIAAAPPGEPVQFAASGSAPLREVLADRLAVLQEMLSRTEAARDALLAQQGELKAAVLAKRERVATQVRAVCEGGQVLKPLLATAQAQSSGLAQGEEAIARAAEGLQVVV